MFEQNQDFFPTPPNLIEKMLEKINWYKVNNILEPSAGKGDLADAIVKRIIDEQYTIHKYAIESEIKKSTEKAIKKVDCIEIDVDLRHILKGKGYKVIHDDFLSYYSMKRYTCIIANFPFSCGDKHLSHALDIIENNSGQLVCLINAETLKNPYSNSRKVLLQRLEELDADIEFLKDEFLEAERKTSVEVALISVKKDIEIQDNSIIINKLKQEEVYDKTMNRNDNSVVNGDFLFRIVEQYNFEIKAGIELIREYHKMKPYILQNFSEDCSYSILSLSVGSNKSSNNINEMINNFIESVRYKYWNTLFHNSEFTNKLTNNLQRDLCSRIDELSDYDFSLYNIKELQMQMNKNIITGVEETILKLFDEFTYHHSYYPEFSKNIHYFNGWSSNSAYKINKKIVTTINGFYDLKYSWGGFRPTQYGCIDRLRDIEKILSYLDKGEVSEVDLTKVLTDAEKNNITKNIELKYFFITFYKKATAHIIFKDEELLNRFNRFGCQKKGWLPPSYGKCKYEDMSDKEQKIIDEFEGKEIYKKVVNNTDYYLYNSSKILMLTN